MDEPSDLTKTQRQRADALVIAARILGRRPSPLAGGGGIPEDRSTEDLVDLAQFILQGEHPLAAYREASLTPLIPVPGTWETGIQPCRDLVALQDDVNASLAKVAAVTQQTYAPDFPRFVRDTVGRVRPVEDADLPESTPGDNPGDDDRGPSEK